MKLTVIGHWGGYPEAEGCTAGYLIQEEGFSLLMDCGSGVVAGLQKYIDIVDLNAVVLSHYHHDHVSDIGPMQYAMLINTMLQKRTKVLPIYGHSYDEEGLNKLTMEGYTEGISYGEKTVLNMGPFILSFCRTVHPAPCCAIKIQSKGNSVVYTGDTGYFQGLVDFSKGCNLLISECSFYAGQSGSNSGHLNSLEAGRLAQEAGVKELVLSHLPHFGSRDELLKEAGSVYKGDIKLAYKGLTWQ